MAADCQIRLFISTVTESVILPFLDYDRLSGKRGVRSVENTECRKCGVWKMGSVENGECGKCGVLKKNV